MHRAPNDPINKLEHRQEGMAKATSTHNSTMPTIQGQYPKNRPTPSTPHPKPIASNPPVVGRAMKALEKIIIRDKGGGKMVDLWVGTQRVAVRSSPLTVERVDFRGPRRTPILATGVPGAGRQDECRNGGEKCIGLRIWPPIE